MTHEGGVVLELGTDVRDIERTLNLKDDVGTLSDLEANIMVTAADVTSTTSVTFAACHGHSALRVGEEGDGEGSIRIQAVELLEELASVLAARDTEGTSVVLSFGRR